MGTPNPTAPQSGAAILVQCLLNHGVDVVFAYPGGASMPIHQALTHVSGRLRTILPRHEQGGGFAAEGYARATGKVGVCIATSGPGATNFVTTLADAKLDSTPLLAITGQVGTAVIGTDAFQETPIVETCRAVTKHHYLVTRTEDIVRVFKEAFHLASTGRPGPVIVDVPKDLQNNKIVVDDWDPPMNLPGYKPFRRASRAELEKVLDMVRQAKKPIIYAGGGIIASEAAPFLKAFAERAGIPVALTLLGLGGFPSEHFLCLQMLGMHGTIYANYAINDADLLLALGVRFDDRVTGKVSEFAKHGKIVHIDIDPSELNKNKVAHLPICGDVCAALQDLLKIMDEKEPTTNGALRVGRYGDWLRQIEHWRETEPLRFADRDDAILPQYTIQRLYEILKARGQLEETIVTTGVGQHQMWSAQYFHFNSPRRWITSGGLGSMGFGLPSAMGAQAAHPGKTVVDIDGDGSFLMNIQELACCFTEKLPVKVLLLNNQHLGMVVQWEDRFHGGNRAHTYLGAGHEEEPYPDFVTLAKGFRCGARRISAKNDVDGALEEMLDSDGPFVLDVMVPFQEHVLPMIPSGQTVRDMIKAWQENATMNAIRMRKLIDSDTPHWPELRALIGKTVEILIVDETPSPAFEQLETEETMFGLAPPLPTPDEHEANMRQLREDAKSDPRRAAWLEAIETNAIDVERVIQNRGYSAARFEQENTDLNAIRIHKQIDSDTPLWPELRALIGKTVEVIVLDETLSPAIKQLEMEETFFGLAPPLPTPEEHEANMRQLREDAKDDPKLAALLEAIERNDLDIEAIIRAKGLR